MRHLPFLILLGLGSFLAMPGITRACPMCSEGVPATSSAEEEDQGGLARAYNNSIYLMVGVPYLLLGSLGFMVYRHLRIRGASEQAFLNSMNGKVSTQGNAPFLPDTNQARP